MRADHGRIKGLVTHDVRAEAGHNTDSAALTPSLTMLQTLPLSKTNEDTNFSTVTHAHDHPLPPNTHIQTHSHLVENQNDLTGIIVVFPSALFRSSVVPSHLLPPSLAHSCMGAHGTMAARSDLMIDGRKMGGFMCGSMMCLAAQFTFDTNPVVLLSRLAIPSLVSSS